MITDKGDYIEFYDKDDKDGRKECAHQVDSFAWVTHHYDFLVWHSKNEGQKTIQQAVRDQQEGIVKGVSDFVILIGFGANYPFAAIELKRASKNGSRVSKEQAAFLRSVRERGGFAAVAYGFNQFKAAIKFMME